MVDMIGLPDQYTRKCRLVGRSSLSPCYQMRHWPALLRNGIEYGNESNKKIKITKRSYSAIWPRLFFYVCQHMDILIRRWRWRGNWWRGAKRSFIICRSRFARALRRRERACGDMRLLTSQDGEARRCQRARGKVFCRFW